MAAHCNSGFKCLAVSPEWERESLRRKMTDGCSYNSMRLCGFDGGWKKFSLEEPHDPPTVYTQSIQTEAQFAFNIV